VAGDIKRDDQAWGLGSELFTDAGYAVIVKFSSVRKFMYIFELLQDLFGAATIVGAD